MKKIVLLILLLTITYGFSQVSNGKNFIDQNYIDVTGRAEMKIIPNQIYLKVFLNENDNKGREKVEILEKKMIMTLKEIGIDIEKNVSVADFSSTFNFGFLKKTDIRKSREYQVLVEDAEKVGNVIAALEKNNISNVSVDRVDHSDMEKFRKDVKIKAIKAAREKAIFLTAAIDQEIGKAIYIQELSNAYQPSQSNINYQLNSNSYASRRAIAEVPRASFKKIELTYGVSIKFILL
ncbi:SIMPL domain-containing protein [uncultured Aquimarina sp.]|uniref:SIMPL domain-containing protein n=1 Tax=uncultured Aquimarina sp. TaxID=575652 RepID=UPI00260D73DB|nr:SIMPL domain-containing protein [uncultured Aquimarina sp.]